MWVITTIGVGVGVLVGVAVEVGVGVGDTVGAGVWVGRLVAVGVLVMRRGGWAAVTVAVGEVLAAGEAVSPAWVASTIAVCWPHRNVRIPMAVARLANNRAIRTISVAWRLVKATYPSVR